MNLPIDVDRLCSIFQKDNATCYGQTHQIQKKSIKCEYPNQHPIISARSWPSGRNFLFIIFSSPLKKVGKKPKINQCKVCLSYSVSSLWFNNERFDNIYIYIYIYTFFFLIGLFFYSLIKWNWNINLSCRLSYTVYI